MGQVLGSGLGMGIVNQFRNLGNSMGNGTNVADPGQAWGDMDSSQKGVELLGGLSKGFGKGMQDYQQQNAMMRQPQGGGGMPQMSAPPPVDASFFMPSPTGSAPAPIQQPQRRGPNMMNFYGGQ